MVERIWDYLHESGPTSINALADALGQSPQVIEAAVDHEWFTLQSDVVAIAIQKEADQKTHREEPPAVSEKESIRILRNMFTSGG